MDDLQLHLEFVGEALASRGFVAVLPNYRLYPAVRFPEFVNDGARSVAWLRDNVVIKHVPGHEVGHFCKLYGNPLDMFVAECVKAFEDLTFFSTNSTLTTVESDIP